MGRRPLEPKSTLFLIVLSFQFQNVKECPYFVYISTGINPFKIDSGAPNSDETITLYFGWYQKS